MAILFALHDMPLTETQLDELRSHPVPPGANRIQKARAIAAMTQARLAADIGISQGSLSDLERSRYGATTVDTASKFSTYFGCSIEDLFPVNTSQQVAS